jgi:hypothetical protein
MSFKKVLLITPQEFDEIKNSCTIVSGQRNENDIQKYEIKEKMKKIVREENNSGSSMNDAARKLMRYNTMLNRYFDLSEQEKRKKMDTGASNNRQGVTFTSVAVGSDNETTDGEGEDPKSIRIEKKYEADPSPVEADSDNVNNWWDENVARDPEVEKENTGNKKSERGRELYKKARKSRRNESPSPSPLRDTRQTRLRSKKKSSQQGQGQGGVRGRVRSIPFKSNDEIPDQLSSIKQINKYLDQVPIRWTVQ